MVHSCEEDSRPPHCTYTDFRDLCPGSAGAGHQSARLSLDHVLLHTHCPLSQTSLDVAACFMQCAWARSGTQGAILAPARNVRVAEAG